VCVVAFIIRRHANDEHVDSEVAMRVNTHPEYASVGRVADLAEYDVVEGLLPPSDYSASGEYVYFCLSIFVSQQPIDT
jgi:hypothetical protein